MTRRRSENPNQAKKASSVLTEKLRLLREETGLSQAAMGKKLGVVQPKVAKFELGHSPLYHADLWAYHREFGVPLNYLCDDTVAPDAGILNAVKKSQPANDQPANVTLDQYEIMLLRLSREYIMGGAQEVIRRLVIPPIPS